MAVNKNSNSPGTAKAEVGPVMVLTPCHNSHDFFDRRIVVPRGEEHSIKIGRAVGRVLAAPGNAIFDCKVLSRNHALIWSEDDCFFIKDTKSSNGTFINNSRLSNSGEESAPTPLASGDILQLGVEIVDNAKKVASGCVVAMVRFLNEKGEEVAVRRSAVASTSANSVMMSERIPKHCLVVPEEQMYQLQHYIFEAKHRESVLSQKLAYLQEALKLAQESSEANWQAMINEERLLSRIEVLESQLSIYAAKTTTPDEVKDMIAKYGSQKNEVELAAKDRLRKKEEELSETRLRLQDVEAAVLKVEENHGLLVDKLSAAERAAQNRIYEFEKLQNNYDVVCQELELERNKAAVGAQAASELEAVTQAQLTEANEEATEETNDQQHALEETDAIETQTENDGLQQPPPSEVEAVASEDKSSTNNGDIICRPSSPNPEVTENHELLLDKLSAAEKVAQARLHEFEKLQRSYDALCQELEMERSKSAVDAAQGVSGTETVTQAQLTETTEEAKETPNHLQHVLDETDLTDTQAENDGLHAPLPTAEIVASENKNSTTNNSVVVRRSSNEDLMFSLFPLFTILVWLLSELHGVTEGGRLHLQKVVSLLSKDEPKSLESASDTGVKDHHLD